jgi:hypothetical protein
MQLVKLIEQTSLNKLQLAPFAFSVEVSLATVCRRCLTIGRTVGSGPFRVVRYRIKIFNGDHFEIDASVISTAGGGDHVLSRAGNNGQ